MNTAILYLKKDNRIQLFFSNIKAIYSSKIEYENGGCVEGFDENEIGVIVVDSLSFKYDEEKQKNYLEDVLGNKHFDGDTLPEGLIDLSEQFKKPTIEDLTNKTIILSEENESLKQENEVLKASVMELVSVAAMQEETNKNNSQAIMELSSITSTLMTK